MKNIAVLYTSIGNQKEAEKLANIIISQRLAACIHILPGGKSIYFWNGKVEQNVECYMLLKTKVESIQALEELIIANHPYELPSILRFSAEAYEKFANYISQSLCHQDVK